ncbi:phosphate transport system permease protein PstA [Marmoricola endophyticus]|uniref:Phosphate transport system permease protein PstA n=1 Tax=Marmoricola endophyticus TaxID=2040280 RepID=A0A917BIF0_9ACTN|nr:phosphate ABC transporter permease PstA [Marmoricola endophyticus]GGF43958.1 phosphate transport system permease protein PstA [Marmoricola endophyticus]
MTTTAPPPTTPPATPHLPLRSARLPRSAPALVAVASLAAAGVLALLLGWGIIAWAVVAGLLHLVAITVWSRAVENPRAATDRFVTSLIWMALIIAFVPLVSLLYIVVENGAGQIDGQFLTYSMRNVVGEGGGIYHSLVGTLLITLGATVISVPIGLMTSIYLVEYGARSKVAGWIRFLVDVMTGIPSIVAGLFAFALFALIFNDPGIHFGIGGSVALSLLMIPIVVRSAEEMLKLVPGDLREASYALGVPKWRTIVKVVIPTALPGIITGVTLAVSRVIGETAPLLIIAGSTDSSNFNLFGGQMSTLPVFIYYSYTQPGLNPEFAQGRAWGAALVLIVIVMLLNLLARVLGKAFAPKTGR